jgi:hypothetical protein
LVFSVSRCWVFTAAVKRDYLKNESVKKVSISLSLFLLSLVVYLVSPVRYLNDSAYSILMDEAILEHGTPDMEYYQVPRGQGLPFKNHGYWYTIDLVKGRLLYVYPWGEAFLSLPAVAFFAAVGLKAAPHGVYKITNELVML